jgi:hypothetical protein
MPGGTVTAKVCIIAPLRDAMRERARLGALKKSSKRVASALLFTECR